MRNNFRIVIPRNVDSFLTLAGNILAKHTADGSNSLLGSLNMADMQAKYTTASARHAAAEQYNRDKETAYGQRNAALGLLSQQKSYTPDTVRYYVKSIRDHLLGVFKGREYVLGDWTFEVNSGSRSTKRVVIPRNAERLIKLAKGILAKHEADDEETLLGSFDMAAFADLVEEAETQHALAEKLDRDKEAAYDERNQALGYGRGQRRITPATLLYHVVAVRDVLVGNHKGTESQLGYWGFEVNTSLPPTPPPPVLAATVQGTVTSVGSGAPLGGVTLVFHSSAGNTVFTADTLGQYSGDIELPAPEGVMVEIFHAGFQPVSQMHHLTPEQTYTLNFALMPVVAPG